MYKYEIIFSFLLVSIHFSTVILDVLFFFLFCIDFILIKFVFVLVNAFIYCNLIFMTHL